MFWVFLFSNHPTMRVIKIICCLLVIGNTATFAQQSLYADFPENFEAPDTSAKAHYKKEDAKLKTGTWTFDQAILGGLTGHDKVSPGGKQSVRMNQNRPNPAYLEMAFDLSEGASKVTVAYAAYYNDVLSIWRLEYSTDSGATWLQAGKDITADSNELKTVEFPIDIKGKIRFRITKLGLGNGKLDPSIKNGRLSIDDFAVYKN